MNNNNIPTKKIILVNFPSEKGVNNVEATKEKAGYNPSFSLITLGTWLEFHGYDVELIDLYADPISKKKLFDKVLSNELVFLGVSIHTENTNMSLSAIKEIKRLKKDLKIVVGGPHASLCPEDILLAEGVDFVAVNEGEGTLLELAEALTTNQKLIRFDDIQNLVYLKDGKYFYTGVREKITDMDSLPIIKREFFNVDNYGNIVNIISGRGCPGNCIYCAATALSGKKYRARSVENVFLEILLIRYICGGRLNIIYFVDDTFTVSKERVLKFTELIKKYHTVFEWWCQSRVDQIDEEMIDAMAETGCSQLLYGVESGNQEVLKKIGKNIKLEQVLKVMEYTAYKKLHIQCSFIVGHYCDTRETMNETIKMIEYIYDKFRADIAIYINTPFPGTVQYINREKLGIRIIEKNYSKYDNFTPIIETDNFTLEDQRYYHQKCLAYYTRFITLESEKEKLLKNMG